MQELIIKIIPIILCLILGMLFKRKQLLSEQTIEDLKFIVINVALPPVLFQAFSRAELAFSLLTVPVAVFMLCLFLFGLGTVLKRTILTEMHYVPFYVTGFEFGMIGSALLISLYGISAIKNISLIIIGHELFIWFIYFPFIGAGKRPISDIFSSLKKSPIIIAIVAALIINISGLQVYIIEGFTGSLIGSVTQTLASLIAPLILFIVGYNLTFSFHSIKKVIPCLVSRLLLVAVGSTLLLLILFLLQPDYVRHYLVYILLFVLLPPPYILPLFIDKEDADEIEFFSGANVYYTIISFVLIFVLLLLAQLSFF